MAYLRPEHFTPDPRIKAELGLSEDEPYAVLRFVAWGAYHDWGREKTTSSFQRQIHSRLAQRLRVFVSAEGPLPPDLETFRLGLAPHRFHDAIASATLVVGDGSTTITEAAALGVPALYISTFAESFGVIRFFRRYGLLQAASTPEDGLRALDELLGNSMCERYEKRRQKMLDETIDVATFIADQCELHSG